MKISPVSIILCVSCETVAQGDIALATKKAKLQTLSENLTKRDENNRRQAQESARRMGIPLRRELPNGKVLELQRISPDIGPIFYITNNVDAAHLNAYDWNSDTAEMALAASNGLLVSNHSYGR
jgi:hypothetical protein